MLSRFVAQSVSQTLKVSLLQDFEEFSKWIKKDTMDPVVVALQHSIKMTRLLTAAKNALVYAVDKGSRSGRKAIRELFDAVDLDGDQTWGMSELEQLVEDLRVDATTDEIWGALQEIDRGGTGEISFDDVKRWWCGAPSPSKSGQLRSKLKLQAFTAKASGPVLVVAETSDEGAGTAEAYLNELLSSAFSQQATLHGKSLFLFSKHSTFRRWCQKVVSNPVTDRVLVLLIFGNIALMALQTPDQPVRYLSMVNFAIMIVFSAEMAMRIVTNGLTRIDGGKTAYLTSAWDVFDFVILNTVWALYLVDRFVSPVPENVSYSLVMLRSFRALRFFKHIRNVINAIIAGRKMTASIMAVVVYLIGVFYVVGYSLFTGVVSSACTENGTHTCPLCVSELPKCPGTYVCDSTCASVAPEITGDSREEHTDKYGFDTFVATSMTALAVITLDDWQEMVAVFREDDIRFNWIAWPVFAMACVTISLFAVNLFLAGLAYSFLKVRAESRSLDAADNVKKSLVERMLLEGHASVLGADRHVLQILNPIATRVCRRVMHHPLFNHVVMGTVLVNLTFMAADHHDPAEATVALFAMAEVVFTMIYVFELVVKLQAMGFKKYFEVILNRFDFLIVMSSLMSYVLLLIDIVSTGQGTAVLRVLRLLKFVRAARVARIIFRAPPVRDMIAKAFRGLDTVLSLMAFILIILSMSAIVGMNAFHQCYEPDASGPVYTTFGPSLLASFQVMTGDGWTSMMFELMDCAGGFAAAFFIFLQYSCSFVLANLFVAIFIENFELEDEEKREIQVEMYMDSLVVAEQDDGSSWVKGLQAGIQGVENMFAEDSHLNVLRRKTGGQLVSVAKLAASHSHSAGKKGLSKGMGFAPVAAQAAVTTHAARAQTVTESISEKRQKAGKQVSAFSSLVEQVKNKVRPPVDDFTAAARGSGWQQAGWKTREFNAGLLQHRRMKTLTLALLGLSVVYSALQPLAPDFNSAQRTAYVLLEAFLFLAFLLEAVSKARAYRLFGGPDEDQWPCWSTVFELLLVAIQFFAAMRLEFAQGLLSLRSLRIIYTVRRFWLMSTTLAASLTAAWTALVLMFASMFLYGIIGMNLFSGLLWHCELDGEELDLHRTECEAAHGEEAWVNRPFHFDNILEAWNTLFSVWTMAGWTTVWEWTMNIRDPELCPRRNCVDMAPQADGNLLEPFLYFSTFIIWNSFMLTNLFTGMLCDYFARASGSILMTAEQRNWQFLSLFIVDAMQVDITPPPHHGGCLSLRRAAYYLSHNRIFKVLVSFTIIASILSMFGQQSLADLDSTGVIGRVLQIADDYVLLVFTTEALCLGMGMGFREYRQQYLFDLLVVSTMWMTIVQKWLEASYPEDERVIWWRWLRMFDCLRALRIWVVVRKIHVIRKIFFIVKVAFPQVVNLVGIMSCVFFMFAIQAQYLCGDVPPGDGAVSLTHLFDYGKLIFY